MKKTIQLFALAQLLSYATYTQIKICSSASAHNASVILDISNIGTSGGSKGFLPPLVLLKATNIAASITYQAARLNV